MATFIADLRGLLKIPADVKVPEGLSQENAQIRFLGSHSKNAKPTNNNNEPDPEFVAKTAQWLTLSAKIRSATEATEAEVPKILGLLNSDLKSSLFLLGSMFTLADAVVFLSVPAAINKIKGEGINNVLRWYAHVAATTGSKSSIETSAARPTLAQCAGATPVALPAALAASLGGPAAAKDGAPKLPQPAGGNKKNKQQQKKGKQKKTPKPAKTGKGGGAAANVEPIAEVEIRVGRIIKAWEHPDSEKLWCEEIEVGDEKPRQILSGLRHNFSQEEMLRRVCVVCNLKSAKLGGIPSHGMVLCASNDDHTQVEFLTPPEGAKIGERVTFESLENATPATGSRMGKKKIFIKAAEALKTTDDLFAAHNGRKMMTSAGPVTVASLKACPIK